MDRYLGGWGGGVLIMVLLFWFQAEFLMEYYLEDSHFIQLERRGMSRAQQFTGRGTLEQNPKS